MGAGGLLLLNKLGTGYYRVNYSLATWQAIASLLATDHLAIHPLNRVSIICDVVSLADFGYIPQVTQHLAAP